MSPIIEVIPGKGVGIFKLGDSLWHILDLLRSHKTQYPRVELSWDPEKPHLSPVTIHLPSIALFFPHPSQTLQRIVLPSIPSSTLTLKYETHLLFSLSQPLTRGRVGRLFGPTFGGGNDKLGYPGIEFDLKAGGGREDSVEAITVSPRDDEEIRLEVVKECFINPNHGITLHLPEPLEILLHETTSQDLLVDLGPPLRKFWKEDDRLERMWGGWSGTNGGKGGQTGDSGCFWNYFQYGLDFLIVDGIVTKILVHSNIPGTPLFQRYARCPWKLSTPSADLNYTSSLSSFRASLSSSSISTTSQGQPIAKPPAPYDEIRLTVPTGGNGKKSKKRSGSPASLETAGSSASVDEPVKHDEVKIQADEGDAMVLDRVGEGDLEGVIGVGPSRLVGFDGVIIEEDQKSGGICSVLVWRDEGLA